VIEELFGDFLLTGEFCEIGCLQGVIVSSFLDVFSGRSAPHSPCRNPHLDIQKFEYCGQQGKNSEKMDL
jgi:hypothetical protein